MDKVAVVELFQNNPSMRRYAIWLGLLGLTALWQGYQFYRFSYFGLDFAPLCCAGFISGFASVVIHLSAFRTARQLYSRRHLDLQAAKFIIIEAIFVNALLIILAVVSGLVGVVASPLDIPPSNRDLLSFLEWVLMVLFLFYPFNTICLIMSCRALLFVRRQSADSFGSEYPSSQELAIDLALSPEIKEADTILVKEVWISSKEHLEKLLSCADSTPGVAQPILGFHIPKGFPYVRPSAWTKAPLAFFTRGVLRIGPGEIVFRALNRPIRVFLWELRCFDVDEEFRLRLKRSDISHIGWYQHPRAYLPAYNLPWVRLETGQGELLFIAGGLGPNTSQIRARTQKLYRDLRKGIEG